jgi:hypothetical protein
MKQIDVLSDDVLLGIFDFYVIMPLRTFSPRFLKAQAKDLRHTLVHVCRRWRCLVFGSPRRLNLRLRCTPKTRLTDTLDVWPALPLIIEGDMDIKTGTDNIIGALGQKNRVCDVGLDLTGLTGRQLEKFLAAMEVPFPELTDLRLSPYGGTVIPDSFLGGSAPRLRIKWHSVSRIAKAAFVCYSPCPP